MACDPCPAWVCIYKQDPCGSARAPEFDHAGPILFQDHGDMDGWFVRKKTCCVGVQADSRRNVSYHIWLGTCIHPIPESNFCNREG